MTTDTGAEKATTATTGGTRATTEPTRAEQATTATTGGTRATTEPTWGDTATTDTTGGDAATAGTSRDGAPTNLADQQAALVAALVAGAEVPAGFAPAGVLATRAALVRKRAGEVAAAWPLLAASYGPEWHTAFGGWAASRPPAGSLRDGWDFARDQGAALPPLGREELAERERRFRYDGHSAPRRRSRVAGVVAAVRSRLWISD